MEWFMAHPWMTFFLGLALIDATTKCISYYILYKDNDRKEELLKQGYNINKLNKLDDEDDGD